MTSPIDSLRPVTGYRLTDHHQGRTVRTYDAGHAARNRAGRAADRLNLEYGAHRYGVHPVFGEAVTQRECEAAQHA